MKNPEDRPLEILFLDSDDVKTGLLEQVAQVQQARHLKGVGLKADVKNVDVLAVLDPTRMNAAEEVFAEFSGHRNTSYPARLQDTKGLHRDCVRFRHMFEDLGRDDSIKAVVRVRKLSGISHNRMAIKVILRHVGLETCDQIL